MPELLKAALLGVVEGITEFLPISSTGHLLLASALLRFEGSLGGTFEIFIQLGAVLAVVAFYWRDLLDQVRNVTRQAHVRHFWLCVVLAFLPAAVLGVTLRGFIKSVLFGSPTVIAVALIVGGVVFLLVERRPRRTPDKGGLYAITPRQALLIGFAQSLALVPGVSRSGASILGGLFAGLDRPTATAFSFYLAIPTLGAATLLDLVSSLDAIPASSALPLFVGTVVSAVVAAASIKWLLRYVAHHSFVAFGWYRIVAGVAVLALVALGVL